MTYEQEQTVLIYKNLSKRHNKEAINKKELALLLGVSVSFIDNGVMFGSHIPKYKKLGNSKNSRIIFPLLEVAEFLSKVENIHC